MFRPHPRFLPLTLAACVLAPLPLAAQDAPFANSDLVALSDGAMLATGYIDGRLGPRAPDLLSVISRADDGAWSRADVAVTNSVATWPNVLALTADGQFAIATEPFAQPGENAATFSEIERGATLTVVDISDRSAPTVRSTLTAPSPPAAVDIHPSGSVVAVTFPFSGEIALYPLTNGDLGEPAVVPLGLEDVANTFVPEFEWHPTGRFAAVTLGGANNVAFYRFTDDMLEPWGRPVLTAPLPGKGLWTGDGAHFLVTTINITGDLAQEAYGRNTSLMSVIAFDDDDAPNSPPRRANDRSPTYESDPIQHAMVASVATGMGYVENFAISPDGRTMVGLNMAASWLPTDHPGHTRFSELVAHEIDPETGSLFKIGSTRLPGVVLPQGIVFDDAGRHIALTSYQDANGGPGQVQFWAFDSAAEEPFTNVGEPLSMPRGVHYLAKVPR
ncbi:MAG: hypothetical protein ROR55_11455 [Devosia sp.]